MKKRAKKEKLDLLESADILYKLATKVQGEPWLILNNAIGHILDRFYREGYCL
jgi:hypothetical protein